MVQSVRGMRDVLPQEARRWREVADAVTAVLRSFAYEEVQLPLLEFTELFARGVGEATDIVEKEMYTLSDRDGDSLSLRPEGTASTVRALQEHGLLFNQTQRVFYSGPMFRYEKPQKGRYRQFYQIGAEAFGFPGPDVDIELILMCAEFWRTLGLSDHVQLELNTIGAQAARAAYREALVAYLEPRRHELDPDSQRRLQTNPMRILDSKNETTQRVLEAAPLLSEYIDDESRAHFEQLCAALDDAGTPYVVNPKLVRGLDYYTHTVFEWTTQTLGAQGTVCAGGRYDGLVEQLGGRATPGAGFAVGLDRVVLMHEQLSQKPLAEAVDVYVCYAHESMMRAAQALARDMRGASRRVRLHMGGGNFKKQLKRANASGAQWALILGEQEMADNTVTVKNLHSGDQATVTRGDLEGHMSVQVRVAADGNS